MNDFQQNAEKSEIFGQTLTFFLKDNKEISFVVRKSWMFKVGGLSSDVLDDARTACSLHVWNVVKRSCVGMSSLKKVWKTSAFLSFFLSESFLWISSKEK